MMEEGLRKLYSGDFNTVSAEQLSGGIRIMRLSKRGEHKTYVFKVRDLYGENEEILEHVVVNIEAPRHLKNRMREAKDWKEKKDKGHG